MEKRYYNNPNGVSSIMTTKPNLSMLQEISGGDEEFIVEILEMIVEKTPEAINSLQEHLQLRDYPMVKAVAHKYKSTVNILDHQPLVNLVDRIEHTAEAPIPQHEALETMVAVLQTSSSDLLQFIQEELDKLNRQSNAA